MSILMMEENEINSRMFIRTKKKLNRVIKRCICHVLQSIILWYTCFVYYDITLLQFIFFLLSDNSVIYNQGYVKSFQEWQTKASLELKQFIGNQIHFLTLHRPYLTSSQLSETFQVSQHLYNVKVLLPYLQGPSHTGKKFCIQT